MCKLMVVVEKLEQAVEAVHDCGPSLALARLVAFRALQDPAVVQVRFQRWCQGVLKYETGRQAPAFGGPVVGPDAITKAERDVRRERDATTQALVSLAAAVLDADPADVEVVELRPGVQVENCGSIATVRDYDAQRGLLLEDAQGRKWYADPTKCNPLPNQGA